MRTPQHVIDRLSSLSLRAKLWAVTGVLAVPILSLVGLQFTNGLDEIGQTQSKLDGLRYIESGPIVLLADLQRHRLYGAAVAAGDRSRQGALDEATAAVDRDIETLARTEKDAAGWATADALGAIRGRWALLRTGREGLTPEALISAHNLLVDEGVIPLIFHAGNGSKLYLDHEVATENGVIGVTQDLVAETEAASRAAAFAVVAVRTRAAEQPASLVLRAELSAQLQAMQASGGSTQRWLSGATAASTEYAARLNPLLKTGEEAARLFASRVAALAGPSPTDLSSDELIKSATATLDANGELFRGTATLVRGDLSRRIDAGRTSLVTTLVFSLAAFALAVFLAAMVARSITSPIDRLVEAADRMSLGELDVTIPTGGAQEVGRLAESLARMQLSLRGAIERLRARRVA